MKAGVRRSMRFACASRNANAVAAAGRTAFVNSCVARSAGFIRLSGLRRNILRLLCERTSTLRNVLYFQSRTPQVKAEDQNHAAAVPAPVSEGHCDHAGRIESRPDGLLAG